MEYFAPQFVLVTHAGAAASHKSDVSCRDRFQCIWTRAVCRVNSPQVSGRSISRADRPQRKTRRRCATVSCAAVSAAASSTVRRRAQRRPRSAALYGSRRASRQRNFLHRSGTIRPDGFHLSPAGRGRRRSAATPAGEGCSQFIFRCGPSPGALRAADLSPPGRGEASRAPPSVSYGDAGGQKKLDYRCSPLVGRQEIAYIGIRAWCLTLPGRRNAWRRGDCADMRPRRNFVMMRISPLRFASAAFQLGARPWDRGRPARSCHPRGERKMRARRPRSQEVVARLASRPVPCSPQFFPCSGDLNSLFRKQQGIWPATRSSGLVIFRRYSTGIY
jgi:hypothetical protein